MTEKMNREELVELLGALSGEKDEDVLAAAREIHSKVTAADADWNDLLVGDDDNRDDPASTVDDDPAPSAAAGNAAAGNVPDDTESLGLIDRMLQKPDVSDDLREELEGYREDISEGEFEEMDRKYLRSLSERMKGA